VAKTTAQWAESKRNYLKFAFANPYNLSLLTGGLAASVLTLNPFLAVATLGLEGLWMLHAPESSLLRRLLWDPRFEKMRQEAEERERNARLSGLSPEARQRVMELIAGQGEIRRLAAQNPSFAGEMLRTELDKTDRLVASFIDLSITCARYEAYLASVDERRLMAEKQRWERVVRPDAPAPQRSVGGAMTSGSAGKAGKPQTPEDSETADDPQAAVARKNLAILEKRVEKLTEIHRYLALARGQLLPAHRRPDRHHAVAAGALRAVG
jgi:hypothetical protein